MYFSAADVAALPYRSASQSGVTQIAYYYDLPVIVTKVGGLREIIDNGKSGFIIEPENHIELAQVSNQACATRRAAHRSGPMKRTSARRSRKGWRPRNFGRSRQWRSPRSDFPSQWPVCLGSTISSTNNRRLGTAPTSVASPSQKPLSTRSRPHMVISRRYGVCPSADRRPPT